MPEQALPSPPVLLDPQRLVPRQPLADHYRPAEGERQERHQLLQPLGVGDMRLLQAEAARLEAPEQSLDLPPPAVIGERVGGDARRGDYDVLAARESQPR